MTLKINEIFFSIQGESTFSGTPCIFIRLTYCNLRCSYCDTDYAFYDGEEMSIEDIIKEVESFKCKTVEVTGGEPLMQEHSIELMKTLIGNGYTVLLETGGSLPIDSVPEEVRKIIDFKCPSSNMKKKNLWSILNNTQPHDEIKFVIGNRNDFEWAIDKIGSYSLTNKHTVLFSPVHGELDPKQLAEWVLDSGQNIRLQLQTHKYIWGPEAQGV